MKDLSFFRSFKFFSAVCFIIASLNARLFRSIKLIRMSYMFTTDILCNSFSWYGLSVISFRMSTFLKLAFTLSKSSFSSWQCSFLISLHFFLCQLLRKLGWFTRDFSWRWLTRNRLKQWSGNFLLSFFTFSVRNFTFMLYCFFLLFTIWVLLIAFRVIPYVLNILLNLLFSFYFSWLSWMFIDRGNSRWLLRNLLSFWLIFVSVTNALWMFLSLF